MKFICKCRFSIWLLVGIFWPVCGRQSPDVDNEIE